MSRPHRLILSGVVLVLAVGLLAACGGDDDDDAAGDTSTPVVSEGDGHEDPATTVGVALEDFSLTPDVSSAPHGEITFAAQNLGATPHELLVIRTDLAADALPVDGAEVDESGLDVVVRLSDIAPGMSVAGEVELEPGSYVLFCNVPGHYGLGMTAGFTLE
jgi:hypothetical protein